MSEKILLVDDDQKLLSALERTLHKQFKVDTALGPAPALEMIGTQGPYAVVVSDRQMPVMDGITFLGIVKDRAPATVRIMLSGNVDLSHAVKVVNEGNIFRFLLKPCQHAVVVKALTDALAQYHLVTAEKELLSKTLSGSIKLLTDIMPSMDNQSAGRIESLRKVINEVAQKMQAGDPWDSHLAAMLCPIGLATLPPELVMRYTEKKVLSIKEEQLVNSLPEISYRLLSNIPRLESVAKIVRYQNKRYDGTGQPADQVKGEEIPFGARLLKICNDLSNLQSTGFSTLMALDEMGDLPGYYDPGILAAVRAYFGGEKTSQTTWKTVAKNIKELKVGMVLASDISTTDGCLILKPGHTLNTMTLEKVQNFAEIMGIREPVLVELDEKN